MAHVASDLYGTNLCTSSRRWAAPTGYKIDHDNDVVRPALVLEGGESAGRRRRRKKVEPAVTPRRRSKADAPAPKPRRAAAAPPAHGRTATAAAAGAVARRSGVVMAVLGLVAASLWLGLRFGQPDAPARAETSELLQHLTVFVLASSSAGRSSGTSRPRCTRR